MWLLYFKYNIHITSSTWMTFYVNLQVNSVLLNATTNSDISVSLFSEKKIIWYLCKNNLDIISPIILNWFSIHTINGLIEIEVGAHSVK